MYLGLTLGIFFNYWHLLLFYILHQLTHVYSNHHTTQCIVLAMTQCIGQHFTLG